MRAGCSLLAISRPPASRLQLRLRFATTTTATMSSQSSTSPSLRIGFAGAGMMAEALAKGFAAASVASFGSMVATDINAARQDVFRGLGISIAASNKEAKFALLVFTA